MKTKLTGWGLALGLILWTAGGAWAGTIYVKAGATGKKNGVSWADAYTSLTTALAAAKSGDEIWVAAGTYKPTTGADRTKFFNMTAGVGVYGGFAGTETARNQRNWKTHKTIFSGDIGKVGDSSDNSYNVVGGGDKAVLDGFTVTGGTGAGMFNARVSPTIANCVFSGNSAEHAGGGMYNWDASPTVTNCTFSGNAAYTGGGMYNDSRASPTVTNCTFSGNSANSLGGGMRNDYASPTVINCVFSDNSALAGGGIFSGGDASPLVTNCVFSGNSAEHAGGGMYNHHASLTVSNCTFSGNSANMGGALYNDIETSPTATNCILWQNVANFGSEVYSFNPEGSITFINCDIRGCGGSGANWSPALGIDGGGNRMSDPKYADVAHPAGPDGVWRTADDGLQLTASSPCIDAGLASAAPKTDILGNPRSVDGDGNGTAICDIGAYEYNSKNGVAPWRFYQ